MPRMIELHTNRPELNGFFGTWVVKEPISMIVDVGPATSAGNLLDSLADLGVETIDYILITHIHLDHAGGLAAVLGRYPEARVVCHKRAVAHLVEPSRLWAGSLQVLGEMAEVYGPPERVAEEVLVPHDEARIPGLRVLETPGHAPHHISFSYKGHLFAGEAGGVYFDLDGADYLRPATPPRFDFHVSMKSVETLMALEDQVLCYAHFGSAESSHRMLARFKAQLLRWRDILEKELETDPSVSAAVCTERLLGKDPELGTLPLIPREMRSRERFFLENSVKGFVEYLRASADGKGRP